jgi:hypothetical protein
MSDVFFDRTMPIAQKRYACRACEVLRDAWNRADLNAMTFAEKRAYIKAKNNKFCIMPGERYIKQPQVYDGIFQTFRGIPEITDIVSKYELWPAY